MMDDQCKSLTNSPGLKGVRDYISITAVVIVREFAHEE